MNKHLLLIILLIPCLTFAQDNYTVKLNNINIGSYSVHRVRSGDSILTFTRLDVQVNQLDDTIRFSQELEYLENDSLLDLKQKLIIQSDTIGSRFDLTSIPKIDTSQTIGLDRIRNTSQNLLNDIGDSLTYQTIIPNTGHMALVNRSIVGFVVIDAHKYWKVSESYSNLSLGQYLFDAQFNLYSVTLESPFGDLSIEKWKSIDSLPILYDQPLFPAIQSNVWLPDPENINAVSLSLHYDSCVQELLLTDNSFSPVDQNIRDEYLRLNAWDLPLNDSIQNDFNSIRRERIREKEKVNKVIQLISSNISIAHQELALVFLVRKLELPSRSVFGWVYHRGKWLFHKWVEIGVDEEWISFDFQFPEIGSALRIVKNSSSMGVPFQLLNDDQPDMITIDEFIYHRKSYSLDIESNAFDSLSYKNPSLGISFELPFGFKQHEVGDHQKNVPIQSFKKGNGEYIHIWQLTEEEIENSFEFLEIDFRTIDQLVKDDVHTKNHIIHRQGNSYILIEINSFQADSIRNFLMKRNLKFDI